MNFKEISEWAISNSKKDNNELISLGVKVEKISKVKNILKEGILVRCNLIISNTEKNNKYICEIEEYIKKLSEYGLSPIPANKLSSGNSK